MCGLSSRGGGDRAPTAEETEYQLCAVADLLEMFF